MGSRKEKVATKRKEELKQVAFAKLNNCPIAPRKMRLVADLIRGLEVYKALSILAHNPKDGAQKLEKLLRSAINNWEQKNGDKSIEDTELFVKSIMVCDGGMLKRIQAAPQGRAHRIRKRSNHVTIVVDEINK
jgi:large subunit ribosomal protein L22